MIRVLHIAHNALHPCYYFGAAYLYWGYVPFGYLCALLALLTTGLTVASFCSGPHTQGE